MGALSTLDIIAIGCVFLLIFSVFAIGGLVWFYRRNKRASLIRQRVGGGAAGDGSSGGESGVRVVRLFHDGNEFEAVLPGIGRRAAGPIAAVRKKLKEAGIETPLPTLAMIVLASSVGVFVGVWVFTQHVPGAAIAGAGVVYALWALVKMKANKQMARFDDQFVEALDLTSRSLRAGHTVVAGLTLAAEESQEPVRSVISEIVQQQQMGVALEEALRNVANKHPSQDLKLFAASVAVQIRAGGNLSETTTRLAAVIRERLRLSKRVRVLIAQTQMSKQMLLGLPVVVFVLLNVINPEYVKPMYTTDLGKQMLVMCVASMFLGAWAMNKMAVIRY
jgi:tight adherence protein B